MEGEKSRLVRFVVPVFAVLFLISSISIGVGFVIAQGAQGFDEDLNGDGIVDVIDMVMALNRNLLGGDTNNDAKVNIFDLATIGLAFGSEPGDPHWNPDADVANTVDKIDIFDLATVGKNFNIHKAAPPVLDPPVSVVPSAQTVNPGDSFDVDISIDTPVGVYAFDMLFLFDPSIINATSAVEGGFLKSDGATTYPVISIDNTQGEISIASTRFGVTSDVTGAGNLATITFTALDIGTSNLTLADVTLVNAQLQEIAGVTTYDGTVDVEIYCDSHAYTACFGDDLYWFDSCNVMEDPYEYCGPDSCDAWGADFCQSGDVYRSRTCHDRGCSADSCFDDPYIEYELVEECPSGCDSGQCLIQCTTDSDCGTDGFVAGTETCSADDVYQDYRTYTCNSPGTPSSYCSHDDVSTMNEDCGSDSCGDWGDNYCNGDAVYHSRTCNDRGCSAGACFDDPYTEEEIVEGCTWGCEAGQCVEPECFADTQCGIDGPVGGMYCLTDDVYLDFRHHICNNPGTLNSSCTYVDTPNFMYECGEDYCDTTWGANFCQDGDVYHSRQCYDKGCSSGDCFTTPWDDVQLVEDCQYGCAAGACVIPECFQDSDCGRTGPIGDRYCSNDDVLQYYEHNTCENPGTAQASCNYSEGPVLIEECYFDDLGPFGDPYCDNGDVYQNRTHDEGFCVQGECWSTHLIELSVIENCQHGCDSAECLLFMEEDLHAGVNMVSLPLMPPSSSISFNSLDSDCVVVHNGVNSTCTGPGLAYMEPCVNPPCSYTCLGLDDPLYPGHGYFVKVEDQCSIGIAGHELQSSQIGYLGSGTIRRGENIIGAPTQSASFASIKGSCQIPEDPLMFLFDATTCTGLPHYSGISYCGSASWFDYCYCSVDTLLPGFGYNIWSNNQCSFV